MSTFSTVFLCVLSMGFVGVITIWFMCYFTVYNVLTKTWEVKNEKRFNVIKRIATFGKCTK